MGRGDPEQQRRQERGADIDPHRADAAGNAAFGLRKPGGRDLVVGGKGRCFRGPDTATLTKEAGIERQ